MVVSAASASLSTSGASVSRYLQRRADGAGERTAVRADSGLDITSTIKTAVPRVPRLLTSRLCQLEEAEGVVGAFAADSPSL